MCGGFTCSKNALMALNILYIVVAFALVGVVAEYQRVDLVNSLPIVGGIIACGVFLLIVAIVGLLGAIKHHQVLLFFYMVVLFLLFLVQFSVACACLAVSEETQTDLARKGWANVDNDTRDAAQKTFACCGFSSLEPDEINDNMDHPPCPPICCPQSEHECCISEAKCGCLPCLTKMHESIKIAFRVIGGIGLFFSFTEVGGRVQGLFHTAPLFDRFKT